jgi:hypothetical protein
MALKLSVPTIATRVLAEVELRPVKIRKWLDELPMLNVIETSRKLFSMLSVNNRVAIDDRDRLELLELYRKPVKQISFELQKQYLGLPLPLPEKHKSVAEQSRQFQIEMAFGYKRIVLNGETPENPVPFDKRRQETALAIQRAIRHLSEALEISYEIYSPYPLGAWLEIHTLYRHAESLGITEMPMDDGLNKAVEYSSVGHAYKQALLLDLADPYHLPARLIDKIHRYLDRWAALAQILAVPPSFDPACRFLIDQGIDRAGIVYTGDIALEVPERYRLLHTVDLARVVHMQLTTLQNGQLPEPDGLEPDFFGENSQELLLRLIHTWGAHPKRAFRRSQKTDGEVEFAHGIDAVNYWLNGGRKFVVSSTFVGPLPQRTLVGSHEKKQLDVKAPELEFSTWNVLDESAGGLSLSKNGLVRTRVRVGDIIGLRPPGAANPWGVAAIRWVKSASPSDVEIGVQRLAPGAEAVVVKTVTEEGKESDFVPALLLPELKPLNQPPTLITPRGVFKAEREMYMDDGCRLYKILPTHAIEITSAFERFQFRILNS